MGDDQENSTHKPLNPISIHIIPSPSTRWEVICSTTIYKSPKKVRAVTLEKLWLSADEKSFLGSIAVANLAHQKSVTCRFTFDHWETVSEVHARYAHSFPGTNTQDDLDRFLFSLELPDVALVYPGIMTFHCCILYTVNGQELWDNNDGFNYRVDFRRKEHSEDRKAVLDGASKLQSDILV